MLNHIRTTSSGFTLIEVLVTMGILAFGLLGLASIQSKMLSVQLESYQRAQAVLLLGDITGRINANRANAANYVTGTNGLTPLGGAAPPLTDCTGLTSAALDLCEWGNLLKGAGEVTRVSSADVYTGAMLGARGCIERIQVEDQTPTICTPGVYRITLVWQGGSQTSAPAAALACGKDLYGADAYRRAISSQITIGLPACN